MSRSDMNESCMNESCHVWIGCAKNIWVCHVTIEWVMSRSYMNEEWVMSWLWMTHDMTHITQSWPAYSFIYDDRDMTQSSFVFLIHKWLIHITSWHDSLNRDMTHSYIFGAANSHMTGLIQYDHMTWLTRSWHDPFIFFGHIWISHVTIRWATAAVVARLPISCVKYMHVTCLNIQMWYHIYGCNMSEYMT